MSGDANPIGTGFVASLARPSGNITGMSLQSPELAGKRLEMLRQMIGKLDRVAFLSYRPNPAHRLILKEAQDAAETLNLKIQPLVLETPEEIESALAAIVREKAGALVIQPLFIGGLGQAKSM